MNSEEERADILHDRKRVAVRLKKLIPELIDAWTSRLQTQVDAAKRYKRTVLVDSMPVVLRNLVRALARGGWSYPDAEGTEVAFLHGRQREALVDYDLSQVVDEYALLRVLLVHVLEGEKARPETYEFVHQYLDANIRGACVAFASRQQRRVTRRLTQQRDTARRDRGSAKRALSLARAERDQIASRVELLSTARASRSRTVAILGHDMRAPLTAVLMQAQRIEHAGDGPGASKVRSVAGRIIQAAERMDAMIEALIEADRVEDGGDVVLRVEAGNLGDIARRAIKTVAGNQEYRFVTHFAGDLSGFWDVGAVLRAIENLCNNAIKYGSNDRPITVSCTVEGESARVGVHNHGSYLTRREQQNLFRAYFRREADRVAPQQGWGLGLVQVHQVAEAHNGQITVHSRRSAGTAFCLHLLRDCRVLGGVPRPSNTL